MTTKNKRYGIALDIGTTTLAMDLVDLKTGEEVESVSGLNAQRKFGQDVLTRITYEYRAGEKAMENLQKLLVDSINELLAGVCKQAGIREDDIEEIVVAANCVMTHTLLGQDARGMGRAPYQTAFLEAQSLPAKEIGIAAGDKTMLYCLPQVSAFLGGDIVAGVYERGLYPGKADAALFIDIGTNGELVLATCGGLVACSCAVGPALEGMNITHGMVAKEGAIEEVVIRDGKVQLQVIGDSEPKGLCGSGVLSAVRELLKNGTLDVTGRLLTEEFLICQEPKIAITQKDIRQIQLAKGAILAAIRTLLQHENISMEKIDRFYVAGQFGEHLSEHILIDTGILPREAEGRISYVGNTSKKGAKAALLSKEARKEMEGIAGEISYLELSNTEGYMQLFMESMNFPEMDM